MFLTSKFFLHEFPIGGHWCALKVFCYFHKHTYDSFTGNFMHECKALLQIKLLSFKSFSPVISSLISLLENAASDAIDMALPRL